MSIRGHRADRELVDTVESLKNLSEDLNEISILLTGKTRDSYIDHEIGVMRAILRTLTLRILILERVTGQTNPALKDHPF